MSEPGSISRREVEVLELLGEHLTNAEIAERLVISIRTVESHVAALMRKLDAPNRRALARAAESRRTTPSLGSLPAPLSPFIGREAVIHAIGDAVAASRLVTVTGPGGAGKTRTTIEAARATGTGDRWPVWFVDLAPLTNAEDVLDALATTIGARSEPGRTTLDIVCALLGQGPAVVLLDNCEHLLGPVARLVGVLLRRVHGLRLLLTSREALAVPGERVVTLGALETPDPMASAEAATATEAVRLFTDRASAVRPGFDPADDLEAVTSIVRRLDGMPLAIELAAAQVIALEPRQIDDRLRDRFTLLAAGAGVQDPRHGTLRGALDWSYRLLSDRERELLDRLSLFRGSFSLEAVEALHAAGDASDSESAGEPTMAAQADATVAALLTALVRKSLVEATGSYAPGNERRFRLLEIVREFAFEQLEASGDADAWRDRHLHWVIDLAGHAIDGFHGPEQARWLDVLDEDLDNIEAALEWAVTDPVRAGRALDPVALLQPYWLARGTRRARGARWTRAMSEAATGRPATERTRGLVAAVSLIMWNDLDDAEGLAATAAEIAADDPLAGAQARLASTFVECLRGEHLEDWSQDAIDAGLSPSLLGWLRAFLAISADVEPRRTHDALVAISNDFAAMGDEHLAGSLLAFAADFGAIARRSEAIAEGAQAIEVAQRFGCASCLSAAYTGMSVIDLARSPADRAALARDAVANADSIGEVWAVLMAVEALAAAIVDGGDPRAGLLISEAAASVRRSSGYPAILPSRAAAAAGARTAACDQLPAADASRIAQQGADLDYRTMVDLALA